MRPLLGVCLLALLPFAASAADAVHAVPTRAALDAEVASAMKAAQANGLAIAVIDDGKVVHVAAYGHRNAKGDPLQTATVMYGASLTKAVCTVKRSPTRTPRSCASSRPTIASPGNSRGLPLTTLERSPTTRS